MRLRKKPWAEPEMRKDSKVIFNPSEHKGHWKEVFGNTNPIYLELGCGKGRFITQKAQENPDMNFIALDYQNEVLIYLLRKINELNIENVRILPMRADFLEAVFSKDEISKIYINFCNPWPKDRHQKRRLTHTRFLEKYDAFLKKGGSLEFKTDDTQLYNDSLRYFDDSGYSLIFKTADLHNSDLKGNAKTEYEEKFSSMGIKIKYASVARR